MVEAGWGAGGWLLQAARGGGEGRGGSLGASNCTARDFEEGYHLRGLLINICFVFFWGRVEENYKCLFFPYHVVVSVPIDYNSKVLGSPVH